MMLTASPYVIALPEIILLTMMGVILVIDVFISVRYRIVTYLLTQLTLAGVFFITVFQFNTYPDAVTIFSDTYVLDKLALVSKMVMSVCSAFAFAYAREYLTISKIARSEYYLLGLMSVMGMFVMASAESFLTIYLGLELVSLPLYAMVAMHKNANSAIEAAMKYFILGSFASGLLLYGISLLYGITGTIQLEAMSQVLAMHQDILLVFALIFVLGGLIFKFGAVPFHMWVPDVYEGAATPTTLLIASAPKIAAFVVTMRILVHALPSLQVDWQQILIVSAILSMFFGNVLAIVQSNLKRMLAYSSIAHIGYTLLGIIAGPDSSQGYSAAMFYISTYVFIAAGAFAIITLMSKEGRDLDKLEDYRALNARNPWLAFMMLLLLFSMAGVPPTVGFFAKFGLIEALVQAQEVWLAVLALIFALIGAYYYLRVVMLMYFEEPTESALATPITISPNMMIAITINGSAALIIGLLPSFFIDLCRISVG